MFGAMAVKEFPIHSCIHKYDYFICGVDEADHLRSYYYTQRAYVKNWKPL